ncbi:MAG: EamA family transporter [Bacteroidales bacterium]|nr:EamA family transporter [Candidatus Cacconaster caballi]
MWLWAAIASAVFLGVYEVIKKEASGNNSVLNVLLYATAIGAMFFVPFALSAVCGWNWFEGSIFQMEKGTATDHLIVFGKSLIVTVSWISGLYGLKNLPITIVGPLKATRPVFILIGSILIYGEHLNGLQWAGILISMTALFMLSISSRREGVSFIHNKWIGCMAVSVLFGVVSALIDKKIMTWMSPMFVQAWCNIYIAALLALLTLFYKLKGSPVYEKLNRDWTIVLIALFLTISDFLYFFSLTDSQSMISIVSMLRRCSVVVTFILGAMVFKEKNLKAKGFELVLMLVGAALLVFASQ